MKMIKAIVRPEKCDEVLNALCEAGYRAVTRFGILGRGKQRGLKVDAVYYDEIPKEMLMLVVEDSACDKVTDIIIKHSRTSDGGSFGDGKIFVLPVEKAVTVSSGKSEL
jgi:nitrogen regulatory protein PII 1